MNSFDVNSMYPHDLKNKGNGKTFKKDCRVGGYFDTDYLDKIGVPEKLGKANEVKYQMNSLYGKDVVK